MKRVNALYRNLRESMPHAKALEQFVLPTALNYMFPEDGLGTDSYYFQYDEELDLDPMFG